LNRFNSEQRSPSVKIEEYSPNSEDVLVKEECFSPVEDYRLIKLEETYEVKESHLDNKNIEKT
jgi:hypothetical protein